jgi:hypothetical protein
MLDWLCAALTVSDKGRDEFTSRPLHCDHPRPDVNVDIFRDCERLLRVKVKHLDCVDCLCAVMSEIWSFRSMIVGGKISTELCLR